jgi:hypothetical protein
MTLIVLALAMIAVTLLALYRRHRDDGYIELDDSDIWAVMPPPPPHARSVRSARAISF